MRILHVEDNQVQATIVEEFLRTGLTELELSHAESLAQAMDQLEAKPFDLILLDLGLPDGDGLEVVFSVLDAAPETPIVVLTAQGEEGLGPLCIQAGASDFLFKRELTPDRLVKVVEYGVSRKTESVTRDLGHMMDQLRAVSGLSASSYTAKFGKVYSRLIEEPHFLMTEDHRKLAGMLVDAGITGPEAIALHADCLENACREADDRSQIRYLNNCHAVLMATLSFVVDYQRETSRVAP